MTAGVDQLREYAGQRFWARVRRWGTTAPHMDSPCWLWTGAIALTGYGALTVMKKTWTAHRLSFTLTSGAIPKGASVLHRCDVRACVRPDHLYLGNHRRNAEDAMRRGRLSKKLTEDDVREILASLGGGEGDEVVARKHGVTRTMVGYIRRRDSWRHVET